MANVGGLIFGSDEPQSIDSADNTTYCMGTLFTSDIDGKIPQIHWRSPLNVPGAWNASVLPIQAQLWRRLTTTIVGTAEFTPILGNQWEHELVDWDITANTEYIFSIVTDRYTAYPEYFLTGKTNGHITAPPQAGMFNELGSAKTFFPPAMPTTQYRSGAYFLDFDFVAAGSEPSGPSFKVWNGSAEVPATVKLWNGSAEVPVSLSAII